MALNFLHPLVACLGDPVAENPTEVMMNAAFEAMGLDWRYLTIEVKANDLGDAVRGLRACQFRGFNCTIPHKVAVLPLLDELSPAARKIGAVNCVAIRDGRLLGDNTDGKGFLQSVSAVRPVAGLRVVILGAGGAARAIGVELALGGAGRITVVNRNPTRGETLAELIRQQTGVPAAFVPWEGMYPLPADADVLVNATSIGLFPDVEARVPIDLDSLRREVLVCDVIPNPPRTRLIRDAEARGCATLDGLGMLVNQGVIGVKLWTGQDPDPAVMRRALETVFNC
jgi:shikimate dehydrogenase